jgi:hypothetical protein
MSLSAIAHHVTHPIAVMGAAVERAVLRHYGVMPGGSGPAPFDPPPPPAPR